MFGITGNERVGASAKDKKVLGVWEGGFDLDIILKGKLRAWKEKDIKVIDSDNSWIYI